MEETKEEVSNQKSGRQMTTYSAEMKLSRLTECRKVAGTVSIARFAREHDLSFGTTDMRYGINALYCTEP